MFFRRARNKNWLNVGMTAWDGAAWTTVAPSGVGGLNGVFLHDAGKVRELTYGRAFGYSDEGQLVGHIAIGLEMLAEIGFTKGIENYSRHLSGRGAGEAPPTLMDYLPPNALMIIDESHVTISQIGGMYKGDRARKENLVNYGFRLPSALDNRPLRFDEFEKIMRQAIFVSATPSTARRVPTSLADVNSGG